MTRNVHLVGSVGLEDAATVFKTLGETVGSCCTRFPDGETGERGYWIRWQKRTFDDHPSFELIDTTTSLLGYKDKVERPFYKLVDGTDPADVTMGNMGYADEALASWDTFKRLRDAGDVPAGARFQVSLPSPSALINGYFTGDERLKVEPIIEAGMIAEVARIAEVIPHGDLAIQWDVCHEVVGADGGMGLHFGGDIVTESTARIHRLLAAIPDGAEAGIHLCYGDPGHKHIIEPKDLGTCVAFANAIIFSAPRRVDFIHMPVPRDRDDDAYFAPLGGLDLPAETELILGLVHYTDGAEGTRKRMAAADAHAGSYGVATECGFGRRDPETIPALLKIHADVAAD